MNANILFSDSDDDDLEVLQQVLDSESDENDAFPFRNISYPKCRMNYMHILNDAEFTFRFRLNKAAVEMLLPQIIPFVKVTSKRNNGIAPLHQLLLALRFYALGTMLVSVADFVGVSKSSASRIVSNISEAIAMLYSKHVVMHQNSTTKFYSIAQFPRVLGVIDCTHVRIQCPDLIAIDEYRNNNGYISLNVQAVCDADLKLMNVVARWPGSTHDATIFNNSVLRAKCDVGTYGNRWLLGDSAYPNRSYLLTPVLHPNTSQELRYNEAHIITRNTIEQTFGIWKRRFPVIAMTMRLSQHNIQAVIIATAVLHNMCRNYNIEEVPPEVELQASDVNEVEIYEGLSEQSFSERTKLINEFF